MAREVSRYEDSLSKLEPNGFLGCRNNVLFEPEESGSAPVWQQSAGKLPSHGGQVVAVSLDAPSFHVGPAASPSETADRSFAAETSTEATVSTRTNVDALLERMQALAQARRALVAQLQVLQCPASGRLVSKYPGFLLCCSSSSSA